MLTRIPRSARRASVHRTVATRRHCLANPLCATHEITRFQGLGEISAGEFKDFIGENIRLDPINLHHLYSSDELLSFFMGKNTPERQEFFIENLRVEKDLVEV